jgi:hypothetical protein
MYLVIIRSQHQHQQNSGSCSPVPGNILSNEENDIYLMNNPYDYHHRNKSTTNNPYNNSSPYNLYPINDNNSQQHFSSSPYDNYLHSSTSRKEKEDETVTAGEKRNSIDFPSSPPPESSASSAVTSNTMNKYPYQQPSSWSSPTPNNDSNDNRKSSPFGKVI